MNIPSKEDCVSEICKTAKSETDAAVTLMLEGYTDSLTAGMLIYKWYKPKEDRNLEF